MSGIFPGPGRARQARRVDQRARRARHAAVAKSFGQAHQIVTDRLLALAIECGKLRGKQVTVLNSMVPRYRWGKRGTADLLFEAGRQTVLSNIGLIREIAEVR